MFFSSSVQTVAITRPAPKPIFYASNCFKYRPNEHVSRLLEPAWFVCPMKLHLTSASLDEKNPCPIKDPKLLYSCLTWRLYCWMASPRLVSPSLILFLPGNSLPSFSGCWPCATLSGRFTAVRDLPAHLTFLNATQSSLCVTVLSSQHFLPFSSNSLRSSDSLTMFLWCWIIWDCNWNFMNVRLHWCQIHYSPLSNFDFF